MYMKKTRNPAETKGKLLGVAQKLMLAKGYAATSVDEICEAAKLTKGCFFHYFDSKEDLGRALLDRFCAEGERRRLEWMARQPKDPLRRVYAQIDFAGSLAKECSAQGCLLGTLAQELSDTQPRFRSLCDKGFTAWSEAVAKDLREAKQAYAPNAAFDPKELAEHFIAVLEGAQLLAKMRRDCRVVARSLEHYKRYVKGLFKRS